MMVVSKDDGLCCRFDIRGVPGENMSNTELKAWPSLQMYFSTCTSAVSSVKVNIVAEEGVAGWEILSITDHYCS